MNRKASAATSDSKVTQRRSFGDIRRPQFGHLYRNIRGNQTLYSWRHTEPAEEVAYVKQLHIFYQ